MKNFCKKIHKKDNFLPQRNFLVIQDSFLSIDYPRGSPWDIIVWDGLVVFPLGQGFRVHSSSGAVF